MIPSALSSEQRQALQPLRNQLLDLHKLLLDYERSRYERENGPVSSPHDYLGLVLSHPQFEWLRQLSGLIVQVDEMLAPRSVASPQDASAWREQIVTLLAPAEQGAPFQSNYWRAIQESPDILLAHRNAQRLLP